MCPDRILIGSCMISFQDILTWPCSHGSIMDRSTKLRRVEALRRRLPHLSASAFASILKELHDDPIDPVDRNTVRKARNEVLHSTSAYGAIMQSLDLVGVDGQPIVINVADPFAMLHHMVKNCPGFASLVKRTAEHSPCSYETPWRLALYSDEVVPGNQLSFHNQRKIWVLYFSFLEFGPQVLSQEDAWICLSICKSDTVKAISGGMAQLFGRILEHMFSERSHNFKEAGIWLDFPDEVSCPSFRLFCKLNMILQDGGAHKQVFLAKGDAGTKFCICCRTLYTEKSGILNGETKDELLTCSHLLESEQDFATDDDIRGTVSRLASFAANCSQEVLKAREQACGFNHHPANMLLNRNLDDVVFPASQFAHDWMHTFLSTGFGIL